MVGLKKDLREDPSVLDRLSKTYEHPVSYEEVSFNLFLFKFISHLYIDFQGQACARQIGAMAYCEVSALKGQGIRQVFDSAVRTTFKPKRKLFGPCLPW